MKKELVFCFAVLLTSQTLVAQTYLPWKNDTKVIVKPAVPCEAYGFSPKDVRITGGIFQQAQKADEAYLESLSPDRFLNRFMKNAGLPPKDSVYGGWESEGVSGHSLGHYLSACSVMYASTGNSTLKQKVDYTIGELKRCQDARKTGYVGAIPKEDSIFNEVAKGNINSKGFDLDGGWVPWYTVHKLMAGLEDAYLYCDNKEALQVVVGLGDWIVTKFASLTPADWQKMLITEQGGMNETLANLYAFTGKKKYLEAANHFYHKEVLDTLAAQKDELAGKHANMQIPKVIGVARLYELTGESKDSSIASFFWNTVIHHHTYVIGGNSNYEYFHTPDSLNKQISTNTTETCNTYNMLKLTRHLFQWNPQASWQDYYERALYNHILASQNHTTGMMCYYVPLQPGARKVFSTLDSSFWCCTGTGMENPANYGSDIYSEGADGSLYVNLFIPSTLTFRTQEMIIDQQTNFPSTSITSLLIKSGDAKKFTVHIRRPWWATKAFTVLVNGKPQNISSQPSSYISITRTWQKGDQIEVQMPMSLYTEAIPGDSNKIAVLYGPLVLAGKILPKNETQLLDVPVLVTQEADPSKWITKQNGNLVFQTKNVGQPYDAQLVPFYAIQNERQTVYWDRYNEQQWALKKQVYETELKQKQEQEARTIDIMRIGEMQPERDHNFKGENTFSGNMGEYKWRDARDGGYFSFTLKTEGSKTKQQLVCTYWGTDGGREFDILVDGTRIATQQLTASKPNEFLQVAYDIPPQLLAEKKEITVTFQAPKGNTAGGLFGCRIVRAAQP